MNPAKYISPKFSHGLYLPDWLLDLDLSYGAMICYAKLARLSLKRGYAFIGQGTLGVVMGVTQPQVSGYIKELNDERLIECKRTGRANHYRLLIHPAMMMSDEEMQKAEQKYADDEPDSPNSDIRKLKPDIRKHISDIRKPGGLYNERENLKREVNNNHHHPFIVWWCSTYLRLFKTKYIVTGKDTMQLKLFLREDVPLEEMKMVGALLLTTNERWYKDNRTITILCTKWNELVAMGRQVNYEDDFKGGSVIIDK